MELQHAIEQVRRASLHPHTLAPMVEELCMSLEEDGAANALLPTQMRALIQELRSSTEKPTELEVLVAFLRGRLRPAYRRSLESRLKQLIAENKGKAEIVSLTHAWITQQINEGFAPGYLFYSVTQRFFSLDATPKITDHSELDAFFETFVTKPSTWTATFKVSRSFGALNEVAQQFHVTLNAKAPAAKASGTAEKAFLTTDDDGEMFASIEEIKARDVVSARMRGAFTLRTLANLGYLHAHRMDFSWKPQALIHNAATGRTIYLDEPTSHVLKRPDCPSDLVGEVVNKTWEILKRPSFDMPSTIRPRRFSTFTLLLSRLRRYQTSFSISGRP